MPKKVRPEGCFHKRRTPVPKDGFDRQQVNLKIVDPRSRAMVAAIEPMGDEVSMHAIKLTATAYYASDPNCCSVSEMVAMPEFNMVPQSTMQRWAVEEKWTDLRRKNHEKWREKISDAVGSQLTKFRMRMLGALEEVYELGLAKLRNPLVKPSSWEGVLAQFLRTSLTIDSWREKLSQDIPDQATGLVKAAPKLTDEEARAAALFLVRLRRGSSSTSGEIEAKIDAADAEDAGE